MVYKDPKYFLALFGEHDSRIQEAGEKKIQIKEIIIHPNWNESVINNDIALAKLETPLDLEGEDSHLSAICIGDSRLPNLDGRNVITSGWGLTSNGKLNNQFHYSINQF